jgi:hypothetical protein
MGYYKNLSIGGGGSGPDYGPKGNVIQVNQREFDECKNPWIPDGPKAH